MYRFRHTLTWILHGCTCVPHPKPPSHLPPHPSPLGHPSAPAPSTLSHASNLDWRFISHMIIYMFQCHSPKSSHPCPLPQSPKDCSIHLCPFCCLAYRVIVTIFLNSIYMRYGGVGVSRSVMPDSLRPHGLQPTRLLCSWDFPGKDTGVGGHFLLQGIFPTQGSNPGILHCRQILYQLSYKGSPIYVLWETLNKNCLVEHHLITGWQKKSDMIIILVVLRHQVLWWFVMRW